MSELEGEDADDHGQSQLGFDETSSWMYPSVCGQMKEGF